MFDDREPKEKGSKIREERTMGNLKLDLGEPVDFRWDSLRHSLGGDFQAELEPRLWAHLYIGLRCNLKGRTRDSIERALKESLEEDL